MTGFGVLLLDVLEEGAHVIAMTVFLVRTEFDLLLVATQLGIASDVGFLDKAQRTDDAEGHLAHLEEGRHRVEASLIEEVHQTGVKQVVLMVAQGNLVAAQFLSQIKHLLAAVPGAKKAGRLLVGRLETGCDDMESYAEFVAEVLEIVGGGLVGNIFHPHVNGLYPELGFVNFGTLAQHLEQAQGVLATRKGNKNMVTVLNEMIGYKGFDKALTDALLQSVYFCAHVLRLFHKHQIDSADDEQEGQDVVPMQALALEHDVGNDAEHSQRDTFLNHLELNKIERSAIFHKA